MENPLSAQLSLTFTMQGATRQIATAFHYKITVSNESRLHVAALSWSCKMLPVALQLTQLTKTSKHLCSTFRWSLFLCRSKLTISSTKWQSLNNCRVGQNNHSLLPTDLIEDSVLIICCDLKVVCQFISPLVPLRPLVGLPRTPSFSHSASLSLCISDCCCPKQNSRRRSLSMLVLCHSDTHHLNRHMVGCGCHEILIPLCYPDEVFCLGQKSFNSTEVLYLDDERNGQRWESNTIGRHQKIKSWWVKGYGFTKCSSLVV